jgi:hypothetical protein
MYRIWLHTVVLVPSLALNVRWGRLARLPLNWAIKGDQVDGPSSRSKKSKANSVEKAVMFRVTQPPGFVMVQELEDQEAGYRVTCTSPGLDGTEKYKRRYLASATPSAPRILTNPCPSRI